MNVKLRFIVAILLLVPFTASACIGPFVVLCAPLLATGVVGAEVTADAAAITFLETAAGETVVMSQAVKNSAMFHAALLSLTFTGDTSKTTHLTAPISIVLDPNTPLTTPAGWNPPVDSRSQPTPPLVLNEVPKIYTSARTFPSSTPEKSCQDYVADVHSYNPVYSYNSVKPHGTTAFDCMAYNSMYSEVQIITLTEGEPTCPQGYSLANGNTTCNLLTSSAVMKPSDNECTIVKTGNSYVTDKQDPDCSDASMLANGIAAIGDTVTVTNPKKSDVTTIKSASDGSTSIENRHSTTDGHTVVDRVHLDSANIVDGQSHEVLAGTGTLAGSNVTPSTTQQSSNITFDKSGLATTSGQSTQLAETKSTNTKLDTINETLKCTDCLAPQSTLTADKTTVETEIKKSTDLIDLQGTLSQHESDSNLFTGLMTSPFPSSASCEPFTHNIGGKLISIDACPAIDMIKSLLTWLLTIYSAFDLLSLIYRKPQ